MKRFLVTMTIIVLVICIILFSDVSKIFKLSDWFQKDSSSQQAASEQFTYMESEGIHYRVKAEGNFLYAYTKGQWQKMFIRGVNIGAGKPGIFPGELTTSYEEYYRWFEMISEMNVNCIRVYTTLRPQFYNALYDFNAKADKPLYLFQGVWINETDIQSLADVYAQNEKILNDFISDARHAVDVIHGNITLPPRAGYASGSYTADVSKYLAGWILGIEWDPKFVTTTNSANPDRAVDDGQYLYTLSATPFEAFLSRAGNAVIQYQTEKYKYQVPVSFSNWVTTDPISHPNEPHPDEDRVSVNVENIKNRSSFFCNLFVTYHVYPYYPDSLNYQKDYLSYIDPYGKQNPYRAYLKDLKSAHTVPILVGEFGIPTSRGMGHENIMGYNQGFVDEVNQGTYLLDMMRSIYEENYAGGFIFTWQDEWFKRTWNNEKFDIPDRRPFWSNIQTNEQNFGILAFDPGDTKNICYIDGDFSEWQYDSPIVTNNLGKLYAKSDERYLYLMIKADSYQFDTDTLLIPIDTKSDQGNFKSNDTGVSFDKAADFLIQIKGKDNTRILVDSYYDSFYFLYGEQYKMLPAVGDIRTRDSGRFFPMRMCFGYEMTVPPENTLIPFKSYETGKLLYGNSNPSSKDYRSLADFIYKDNMVELRIPWQLLNVMDPSERQIMDDLYVMQNITATNADTFSFGLGQVGRMSSITLNGTYSWKEWIVPTYHERLKPSYNVLKEGFKALQ